MTAGLELLGGGHRPIGPTCDSALRGFAGVRLASPVGIWETELTGEPQEEQKRTSSRSSAEQVLHFIGIVA